MNSGDIAWMLVATALVMLMTFPGLALFYGGLVRRKNVLATMMQSFFVLCLLAIQWILWGYSLAFGPDRGHVVGSFALLGMRGVGAAPSAEYSPTIPQALFAAYQMMFAVITPGLITGAFAERMKFSAYVIFVLAWATLVYDPIAHWVWSTGGWLRGLGALDFAGGTVVHVSSGISALVCALVLGKRRGYGRLPMPPHNLPLTLLGAALLWFGWFGFNAGSALAANAVAVSAFLATNTGAAAAALAWMAIEWAVLGKPTVLGGATGAVAGLVAITPASGFVSPSSAILIGLVAGAVCYTAVAVIKQRLRYDDSLDAFGVHGVGGMTGALLTGIFAEVAVNPAGSNGLLFGGARQLIVQLAAVAATAAWAAGVTFVVLKLVDLTIGLRVSDADEVVGLDITQHEQSAYTLLD